MTDKEKKDAKIAESRKRIAAIKGRIEERAKARAEYFAKRKAVKA